MTQEPASPDTYFFLHYRALAAALADCDRAVSQYVFMCNVQKQWQRVVRDARRGQTAITDTGKGHHGEWKARHAPEGTFARYLAMSLDVAFSSPPMYRA